MDDSAEETLVEWRKWGEAAFAEADDRQVPVLLSLTAPWCAWCRRMDRETYGEPRIAAHLHDGFVPVRVDVDRNPRVRERYNMGGFPSTVFVTPSGELLTGATYLGRDGMRQALDAARRAWDAKGTEAGRVPRALRDPGPPAGEMTPAIEAHMTEQVTAAFDEEFGGWGSGAKFPLPRTVEFTAKRDPERATRTLEAIRTHLYDTYDGGFYRHAGERDWSDLHREKLLDENAALVRAFATGYLYTDEEPYREVAAGTVDYLTTDLWGDGAFAASQAGGDYYTLTAAEREAADPPSIDPTIFADRNGLAADALLRFAAYTGHEGARRHVERALDHILAELVEADGRVVHYRDAAGGGDAGGCGGGGGDGIDDGDTDSDHVGLLVDHARVLAGLTTAAQVLGSDEGPGDGYVAAARRVADRAIADLRADDGAFLDGSRDGQGLLDRPLRPLDTNAELADALIGLSYLADDARYRDTAHDALAAFAGASDRMGVEVAGYAAACARDVNDPLVVETPPAGTNLHRAALRVADHEKVVVPGDRDEAVVVRGEKRTTAATPAELTELVEETENR